ncbi:MAG: carboxypeptidase regulatory-like domain-containing protein [Vicinamibacterales bacterium]
MVRCLRVVIVVVSAIWLAVPASAQTARATGTVRDIDGKPIKGATIRAANPDLQPRVGIATSDSKGRWAMIGLRIGVFTFVVDAPGFVAIQAEAMVRTAATPPLDFVLTPEPGLTPGALPSNIQAQIAAASMLREQGRIDQAITTYEQIRAKHASLTTLNLVIAATYRRKAALESDPVARRAALDRAIESYNEMLKVEPDNEHAKTELAAARAEAAAVNPG